MSVRPKICVVGSSNIDLISRVPRLPKLGETIVGHSFHMGFGGKGANQAVMAARLGAQVTMVTKVGRDVFGEGTRRNYQEQGIATTYVMDDERFSGVAPIFVDDSAQNFIVIIPGANLGLSPADARGAASVIKSADALICQLEVPVETTLEAFRVAKAKGVRTILNPAPAAPLPDELLRLTDLCVPNETEAEALTGQAVTTVTDAEAMAQALPPTRSWRSRGSRNQNHLRESSLATFHDNPYSKMKVWLRRLQPRVALRFCSSTPATPLPSPLLRSFPAPRYRFPAAPRSCASQWRRSSRLGTRSRWRRWRQEGRSSSTAR